MTRASERSWDIHRIGGDLTSRTFLHFGCGSEIHSLATFLAESPSVTSFDRQHACPHSEGPPKQLGFRFGFGDLRGGHPRATSRCLGARETRTRHAATESSAPTGWSRHTANPAGCSPVRADRPAVSSSCRGSSAGTCQGDRTIQWVGPGEYWHPARGHRPGSCQHDQISSWLRRKRQLTAQNPIANRDECSTSAVLANGSAPKPKLNLKTVCDAKVSGGFVTDWSVDPRRMNPSLATSQGMPRRQENRESGTQDTSGSLPTFDGRPHEGGGVLASEQMVRTRSAQPNSGRFL